MLLCGEELSYLLSAGRARTCYEVYRRMIHAPQVKAEEMPKSFWQGTTATADEDEKQELLDLLHETGRENRNLIKHSPETLCSFCMLI